MEPKSFNDLDKIDIYKIAAAGKSLKNVVYAVLIMIASSLICVIVAFFLKIDGEMTTIYVIIGIISLVCNIVILGELYSAGDSLEKVQAIQHQLVSVHSSPTQTTKEFADVTIFENLEVFKNDFPEQFSWNDSLNACSELGDDWRLPTINELGIIFQNKNLIGNLEKSIYWTSTEGFSDGRWTISFIDGKWDNYSKERKFNVRAVRSI
jgi:hypothetical protein